MLRSWTGRRACHRAPRQLGRKLGLWLVACVRGRQTHPPSSPPKRESRRASFCRARSGAVRARTAHASPASVARGEPWRSRDSATEARSTCPFVPSIQAHLKIGESLSPRIELNSRGCASVGGMRRSLEIFPLGDRHKPCPLELLCPHPIRVCWLPGNSKRCRKDDEQASGTNPVRSGRLPTQGKGSNNESCGNQSNQLAICPVCSFQAF